MCEICHYLICLIADPYCGSMNVEKQTNLSAPTIDAVKETEVTYKNECTCDRKFKTVRGLKIHMTSCNCRHGLKDESLDINAVFGTVQQRWYRVEWVDHPGEDKWSSLIRQGCEGSIKAFWKNRSQSSSQIQTMCGGATAVGKVSKASEV